jgi:hypothetical protein
MRYSVLENLFVLFGGKIVLRHGAARHHQEEDAPHARTNLRRQPGDFIDLVNVAAGHGGQKLRLHADALRFLQRLHGYVERSGYASEAVVGCSVGAVQADGHAGHAALPKLADDALRQEGRSAGTDVGAQSQLNTAAEEGKKIRPLERIATG